MKVLIPQILPINNFGNFFLQRTIEKKSYLNIMHGLLKPNMRRKYSDSIYV